MKTASLFVVTCIVAAAASDARGQLLVEHSLYGINTHVPSDAVLAKLESAGIAWARIDINWVHIQPNGPNDYNWSAIDNVVASANARGIRLFPSLGYTPGWANGNAGINHLPDDVNHWKDFVRATVNRYRDSIKHWGLWNEPNLDKFLDAAPGEYVNVILIPGAQAIREADPTALRLGPEVAGPGEYIEAVLEEAKDYLDIITVHKYSATIPVVMSAFDGPTPPTYRQILEDAGIFGTKPVWFTEVGWSTVDALHPDGVTEAQQAGNYVELLDAVRQRDWITKVFFYEIADDPTPEVSKFGILRSDLTEKQAYGAYRDDILAHPPATTPAPTEVSIDLGLSDAADGMTHPQVADGDTEPTGIGGRTCRQSQDPDGSPQDRYFYFAVSDAYAFEGDSPEQYITVDYFDAGSSSLILHYDSTDPAPFPNDRYKNGGSVALGDTNTWKRHTFHVTDAYFGNRQNGGADFRIHQPAGEMHLDRIRVTRPPQSANPTAVIQADPTLGSAPLYVVFNAMASYDVDGTITDHAWDFEDDGTVDSHLSAISHTYADKASVVARLTVTDNVGLTDTTTVAVWPGCTTAASNLNRYAFDTLSTGTTYFSDRPYTITSMPTYLEGSIGIKTADADVDETSDVWITFDTDNTTEVYVAYDAGATSIPGWLVNFVDTGEVIGVSDAAEGMARLYRKIFADETVSLGANLASGAAGAGRNYFVLIRANCTVPATLGKATEPSPAHMATDVSVNPTLSWTPGRGADTHNVYFGTASSPIVLRQYSAATSYAPDTLRYDQTYYWRVDEVNASGVKTGDVWSLTTKPEHAYESVPAGTTWGLVFMSTTLLTAGAIMVRRRIPAVG